MKNVLIAILLIVCIALGVYSSMTKEPVKPVIITETDTVFITDSYPITAYVPKYDTITIFKDRFKDVDTAAILKDYFSEYYYTDTIVNDSALFLVINDTITQNKIKYRKPVIVRTYPVINNSKTITIINPENGFYAGGYVGVDNFGIAAEYKLDKNIFGVMYGSTGLSIKYSRKINFKK